MAMLRFDDEGAKRTDRLYASPDVVAQRNTVLSLLAPRPGERVLDVGSGPGYLLESIARAVGSEGAARGLDPSAAMNALAAARTADLPWVAFDEGDATALPYPDNSFDAAVSTQVYEYVPDVPAALAEVRRVLRPGGRVLILDTDADSLVWHTADRTLNRRILEAWDEHLAHPRLPRVLPALLQREGFRVTGHHVHPILNPELTPDSFSATQMHIIAEFVAGRRGVTEADVEAWLADLRERAERGEYFYCLNRYLVTAVAP
ncbi:methyltransferase domain-containing protein [Amycolatopsis rhabdoformis]|uniref:Methyltransferase domain-containing protein n=1 Tax=Amycolatopsis rhabdoformis TaxID=1448059 RepID=A0ABZ1ICY8_9PSEU|nr:methyltransferase domain-containing protein [Amycolatopsis rhabdoformis]WSE31911.1 methyltransferase domain-containing protein [Amycolatopsis rhabdoformis]